MASSRRLPLAYNVSTFGGVTRDYQSLSVWEAATDNDLVTATMGEVLDCYADSASYDQSVALNGATANSSYFRVLRAASGQSHGGIPVNGVCFVVSEAGANAAFQPIEGNVQLQDLCITYNGNSASGRVGVRISGTNNAIIGCVIKTVNSGAGQGIGIFSNSGTDYFIINNLCYECDDFGLQASGANEAYIYNNTIPDNPGVGLDVSGTTRVINNIVQGNGTNINGTPTTDTTNVTSGVIFQDAANDNYLLDSSDTAAQGQGTDLSADASYAFNDDVLRNTRNTPWTVGYHDLSAEAASNFSNQKRFLRRHIYSW